MADAAAHCQRRTRSIVMRGALTGQFQAKSFFMSDDQPEFALEAEGLEKTYRGSKKAPPKRALKGVDLKIRRG